MKKLIFVLTSVVCFNQAKAHDFLTEILVYSDDYALDGYAIVTHYNLTQSNLENHQKIGRTNYDMEKLVKRSGSGEPQEYRRVGTSDCDFGSDALNKTCGVFDHFSQARAAAVNICSGYAMANLLTFSLIPQFIAPVTFTESESSSNDHHELYDFSQGLEFNCVKVIKKEVVRQPEM